MISNRFRLLRLTITALLVAIVTACASSPAGPSAAPEPTATRAVLAPSPTALAHTIRQGGPVVPVRTSTSDASSTPLHATATPLPPPDAILVGAGDIADCGSSGAKITAALLDAITGTVFTLGDNAYPSGAAAQYAECYDPTWGRQKARTRPAPGNHDYETANAAPYYAYFGQAAGEAGKGYYSYDVGSWHVVVLNSNCWAVGGCGAGSPQYLWLVADLAAHPANCALAYWHHPRFSSGPHGNSAEVQDFWQALFMAGADIVLNGHDHTYERFAPQTPDGKADPQHGTREFVVGSGGNGHYGVEHVAANSEVRNNDTYGVLKLTLHPNSYDWQFVPEPGKSFADSGYSQCH